jgi:predicted nucleotide-binding protein
LQFEPVILHELADRGDTIFAKLTGEMSDVGFAFVLLTPDDVGGLGPASAALRPRARQNVVFEHGLFVGHLRSDRVCAITKGEVELRSDLHGVLYKPIHSGGSVAAITFDIVKELRAAGYDVDANRL